MYEYPFTQRKVCSGQSKTMDYITAEENEVVDELRRRTINDVTPKMLEDVSLFYRFAKARDFDLVEAEAMLRKHIEWRKETQIDTILTDYEPPEVLVKYIPTSLVCFDKQGSIVRLNDLGRVDVKGLWNVTKKSQLGKYVAYIMERDKDFLIKKGRNLGKLMYTPIWDFEGLTYATAVNIKNLQCLSYLLKIFVDNFPETIKRIIVINAPFYFTWVFSVMKQVAPKTVIDKFRVYGTEGWKEDLLELIDAENLPAYLGGTKTDPDGNPLCETFIQRGRPIPRSYYRNRGSKNATFANDAEKLTLKPFSKEEITFEVKEKNSILEWEFETKSRDIDFLLLYRGESLEDLESVELIPKLRMECSDEPEKGCFKCEKTGSYTIVFDNTYSWLHSKEVYYKAEVKRPRNDEIYKLH